MSLLNNDVIFSQIVSFKKKFQNEELQLFSYFFKITHKIPTSIIIRDKFIFFLVKNEDYIIARAYLERIRNRLKSNKVLVIREEITLLRQIFSFFPDTYIHDIELNRDLMTKKMIITLFFIFDLDRGIAVGNKGCYINTINFIFNNAVNYQLNSKFIIKIQCKKIFL